MSRPRQHRGDDSGYVRRIELRDTDYAILEALEDGPASTKAIADAINASEKYVAERTNVLRSAGILDRMNDPRDPRSYLHFRTDGDNPLTDLGYTTTER